MSLVVLFAVIISILVYIFRAISRPIIDLTKTVKYIETGNFFVQAPNRPKNEIGVLGTAFNSMVSKLRERTSTLENINAKDEALLNSMGEGVVAVDYDYNVIAINKMAQDLLGYTSPELLGKNFIEGIIQLDENGNKVPDNDRPLILAMNSGKTISASDKYFVNKTGEKFPISLTSAPIIFNSKVSGAVVLFSDISLRKKKDEEMNKLAAIVRSSEDAIIGKTLDGIITSWNRGAEKIYKYTEKEVIGKPVSILAPEDHKDEIFHLLEKVKKGEHIEHYETVRQKKDGSIIQVSLTISPVVDNKGNIIAASTIARDITERKKDEERLREISAYNRRLIEVSLDPLVTIGKDGKITDVNEATENVTGVHRKQLIGDDFSNYFTEPIKASDGYKKVLSDGFVKDYPLTIKHTSGRTTDVLYDATVYKNEVGDIEGVFAAARDVTERKRVEEKLRESEEKFHSIITTMDEGLIFFNKNGEAEVINPAAEKIIGFKSSELLGNRADKIIQVEKNIHEDGTEFCVDEHPAMISLKTGKPQNNVILGISKPDKTAVWISINSEPLFSNNDLEPYAAVATFRDITREREIEKLRVDFLTLVSHQLRTPLSGTKWLIETMQRGVIGESNPKQKEYLENLYQINERMITLVSDILNILTLESGGVKAIKKEKISAINLYENLYLIMEPAAKSKSIILKNTLKDHEDFFVQSDSLIVRTILENLISNSICYSVNGQKVVFGVDENPDEIIFYIKDEGIGIPKGDQERIFERFYRGSNAKVVRPSGTGLGLYSSFLLAKKIGAKISFESEEGMGSTFYLHIPKNHEI